MVKKMKTYTVYQTYADLGWGNMVERMALHEMDIAPNDVNGKERGRFPFRVIYRHFYKYSSGTCWFKSCLGCNFRGNTFLGIEEAALQWLLEGEKG